MEGNKINPHGMSWRCRNLHTRVPLKLSEADLPHPPSLASFLVCPPNVSEKRTIRASQSGESEIQVDIDFLFVVPTPAD